MKVEKVALALFVGLVGIWLVWELSHHQPSTATPTSKAAPKPDTKPEPRRPRGPT